MMNLAKTAFSVVVPATTANLGPGFDCLGLALDLWNTAHFSLEGRSLRVRITGFGAGTLPSGEDNLILQAVRFFYDRVGEHMVDGLVIHNENRFPTGSGLGSSSAAIVIGLLGANFMAGQPLEKEALLPLGLEMEGHPDNVTPALLGGLTISTVAAEGVLARKVDLAPVAVSVVVPEVALSTHAARAALPGEVPLSDAVFNLSRTALVVEALRNGDLRLLGEVMQDRLHQPYRLGLIPAGAAVFEAARKAGAAAVALSGAGPGIVAFSRDAGCAGQVTTAMSDAFAAAGVRSWSATLRPTGLGAHLSR